MKHSFLLLSLSILVLNASSIPMPPAIGVNAKQHTSKNDTCKLIPPMLVQLPPSLEDDLSKCKNSLYLPQKKSTAKSLQKIFKKSVKIKKISIAKGFNLLYKIESSQGHLLKQLVF